MQVLCERQLMKLFVGGLPWATTSDELNQLFSQAGAVISATVISDKMTGRSKGFGFVEMSDEDAQKAIVGFQEFMVRVEQYALAA